MFGALKPGTQTWSLSTVKLIVNAWRTLNGKEQLRQHGSCIRIIMPDAGDICGNINVELIERV